jgi:hypothetical protein
MDTIPLLHVSALTEKDSSLLAHKLQAHMYALHIMPHFDLHTRHPTIPHALSAFAEGIFK